VSGELALIWKPGKCWWNCHLRKGQPRYIFEIPLSRVVLLSRKSRCRNDLQKLSCLRLISCRGYASGLGQAPLNSDLALQPSTGGYVIREQFRSFEGDGIDGHKIVSTFVYGYLAFLMTAPYLWRENKTERFGDDTAPRWTRRHQSPGEVSLVSRQLWSHRHPSIRRHRRTGSSQRGQWRHQRFL